MTDDTLRAAAQAVVDAWVDDESGMETFDPEHIDRLAAALAASAPDEGPPERDFEVIDARIDAARWEREAREQRLRAEKAELARPAAPVALDVERLARAIWLSEHHTADDHFDRNVPPGSPHRAEVEERGARVAAEYEALTQREHERAYERGMITHECG